MKILLLLMLVYGSVFSYDFTFYDTTDGLPSNDVRCLAEDSLGNLWVGTIDGAAMYDGSDWTVIDTSDGLPFNVVHSIMVDRENRIWFGTFLHGVTVYDGTTFTTYGRGDGLLDTMAFNSIIQDTAGRIWIGGLEGISIFDGTTWSGYDTTNGVEGTVYSLVFDSEGTPWAGTSSGMLRCFYGVDWGRPMSSPITETYDISFGEPGYTWYGGHYRITRRNDEETAVCGDNKLVGTGAFDIDFDADGNIWFMKSGYYLYGKFEIFPGLTRFDGTDWITYDETNGLPENRMSSYLIARDGTILVGTMDKGVFILEEYPVPLTLVRPEVANSCRVGDTLYFTWLADTALVDSVHISISPDTGKTWIRITDRPEACIAKERRNHLGKQCRYQYYVPDSLDTGNGMMSAVFNHWRVRITDAGNDSVYADGDDRVLIHPAPELAYLEVYCSPSPKHIRTNDTVRFLVEAIDEDDQPLYQPVDFTWSISGGQEIDSNGVFIAGDKAGGPYMVTVTAIHRGDTIRGSMEIAVPGYAVPVDIYHRMAVGDELVFDKYLSAQGYTGGYHYQKVLTKTLVDKQVFFDSTIYEFSVKESCLTYYQYHQISPDTTCPPDTGYTVIHKTTGNTFYTDNGYYNYDGMQLDVSTIYTTDTLGVDSNSFTWASSVSDTSILEQGTRYADWLYLNNQPDSSDDCYYYVLGNNVMGFFDGLGMYRIENARLGAQPSSGFHTFDMHLVQATLQGMVWLFEDEQLVGIRDYRQELMGLPRVRGQVNGLFNLRGKKVTRPTERGIYLEIDETGMVRKRIW